MKLEQLNLLDVLNDYGVELDQRGIEYWASCPFHEDGKPSFSVSPIDNGHVWYCFSCKSGGGILDFVSKIEKIPEPIATKLLVSKYGLEHIVNKEKVLLTEIVDSLHTDHIKYLEDRGINSDTIKKYKIGYCEDYNKLLLKFGLDWHSASDIGLFDISRCVVYPFFDYDGCFKISARSIDEKQYNSGHKTKMWKNSLWGIDHIRSDRVYVFEGFHDVMIASQNGIPAVAMCGTNMQLEFWKQLKEYDVKDVIFVPDGDYGGRTFLERLNKEYDHTFNVSVVVLNEGDPDDHIKDGRYTKWEEITPLQWYTEYKWNPKSLQEKINMYKDISEFYCKMCVWEQALYKEYFTSKYGSDGLDYLSPTIKPDRTAERIVIANCIYSDSIRIETLYELETDDFTLKIYRNIFEFMKHNTITPVLIEKNFGVQLSDVADIINYAIYIKDVKNASIKFKLFNEFEISKSKLNNSEPTDIVGNLSNKMISIVDSKEHIYKAETVVKKVMNNITKRVQNPNVAGVPFNEEQFPIINRSLLGFVPTKLIFVSAPTGHGKTTIVQNFMDDLLFNKKEEIALFSLEMSPEEIIEKQLAIHTSISGTKILTGSLEQSEYDEIVKTAKELINSKLTIINGVYDLYKISSIAKSIAIKKKCKIMFLDYVQLLQIRDGRDRWEQLMEITTHLKTQVCNPFGVTFVIISQLGKKSLDGFLAEAKDQSGSYGMLADADVAITLRQKTAREISEGSNLEIYIDKHRYGRDKILIPAFFDKGTQRIKEML